jgi:hypothetical protein
MTMTKELVKNLLEKYWEGETSLEEERMLKSYFSSGNVDEQLRPYSPLFQAMMAEKAVQYPKVGIITAQPHRFQWHAWAAAASIAMVLTAGAWWLYHPNPSADALAQTPVRPTLNQPEQPPKPNIAPPALPLATAEKPVINARPRHRPRVVLAANQTEPENPEEALKIIRAALALVSNKMNKGTKEAGKNMNKIETIDRFFKKKPETAG